MLRNALDPVQIFIPPQYLAVWRGDFEHAGDEFLYKENMALFAYLTVPASLFQVEQGPGGENLTFGTGRAHAKIKLVRRRVACENLLPIKKRSALRAP